MWLLLSFHRIRFARLLEEEAIIHRIPDNVIQCIFVEDREIGIQGLSQYMLKPAYRRNDAGVVSGIEALH